jgi:excisionase family DNA binding protein
MSDFYDIPQIAKRYHVTTRTIHRFIERGQLTGFKAGRDWRFSEDDLKNLEENLRRETQEEMKDRQEG